MAWAKNGTPDTLGSAADQLNITDLTENKFIFILQHTLAAVGNTFGKFNTGSGSIDTGSNYTTRRRPDGTGEITAINQTVCEFHSNHLGDDFCVGYMANIATEEKLIIGFEVNRGTAGATNLPQKQESVHKWSNTSAYADHLRFTNDGVTNGYLTDSNLSALGSDLTPAAGTSATISDGAIFYETDTNKSYVLSSNTWTEL